MGDLDDRALYRVASAAAAYDLGPFQESPKGAIHSFDPRCLAMLRFGFAQKHSS